MANSLNEDGDSIGEICIGCFLLGVLVFALIGIPLLFKDHSREYDFVLQQVTNSSYDTFFLNLTKP